MFRRTNQAQSCYRKPIGNIETQQKCCKVKKNQTINTINDKPQQKWCNVLKKCFAELVKLNPAIGNPLTILKHSKSAVRSKKCFNQYVFIF